MVISEVKWRDVRVDTPPYNTAVLAVYLEPIMTEITEQIAAAYYDKSEGWFFEGFNKPIKGVIYWSKLPELPSDSRFDRSSSLEFKSRFSIDSRGNVIPRVVRRKRSREEDEFPGDDRNANASDIVNLQRKHSKIPARENESFMDQLKALNKDKRR